MAPKVAGVEWLDEASGSLSLDFFVLCSSSAAVLGNVGQADYAAANAYLDAFARVRRGLVEMGRRQGETVSINWPLWEEGGMQIEAATQRTTQERMGGEVMGTGIKVLYQALTLGQAQVMVAHGWIERIKQRLQGEPAAGARMVMLGSNLTTAECATGQEPCPVPTERLYEALARTVTHLLKVRVEEVDAEMNLSEYGFNSITFTELANRLNQTYQLDLTPTVFYEHSTLSRLTQYLQATYASLLAPHFALASPTASVLDRGRTGAERGPDRDKPYPCLPQGISPSPLSPEVELNEVLPAVSISRWDSRLAHSPAQREDAPTPATASPIAIIGMSGTFPLAPDVQSFWCNLLAGRDCIGEIPALRWDWQTYFGNPETEVNKTNIKWAGVMEDIEMFDPLFFGISPRDAEQMDPQQRLLMMYVWKAIEDAGYSPESLSGTNTALFVGTMSSGYGEQAFRANMALEGSSATGLTPSVGPNRMSYFLNLHGPSEAIDTACSSSLVAIHRGVNVIESGECSMAIVGGVNTLVSPERHISASKAGMLCEDGRCKAFSAQANGYVRGEGVGMLVLKKLSEAERDGDHIYGVIVGSAENHGGRASSLTAPNPRAQADLLIAAYRKARINPRTVGYIEAHGTGTELGDPIEINGLETAWSQLVQWTDTRHSSHACEAPMPQASCGIGSVKSNIGHLELAAGVAGVIKVLLQMQHKKLVKSLHCEHINPYIELKGSPFYIVQQNREWEALRDPEGKILPRRAGVSSFGFGGVNAHVVLEEYVPKPRTLLSASLALPALIVLSAKNEERLKTQVRQLLTWIQAEMGLASVRIPMESLGQGQDRSEALFLLELAYTLQVGREAMEERLAMQVSSLQELEEKLHRYSSDATHGGGDWYSGKVKRHDAIDIFAADEDGQKAVAAWMSKGKYTKLLEFWVKGGTVAWKHLYLVGVGITPTLPRRISLPTYPFARQRYWIPTRQPLTKEEARTILLTPDEQGRQERPNDHCAVMQGNLKNMAWQACLNKPDHRTQKINRAASHQICANSLLIGIRRASWLASQ